MTTLTPGTLHHDPYDRLGAALARLAGRVALDEVLNRSPEWGVDRSEAKQAHTPHVRGWETLPVFTG